MLYRATTTIITVIHRLRKKTLIRFFSVETMHGDERVICDWLIFAKFMLPTNIL